MGVITELMPLNATVYIPLIFVAEYMLSSAVDALDADIVSFSLILQTVTCADFWKFARIAW